MDAASEEYYGKNLSKIPEKEILNGSDKKEKVEK
jgi:hypothetical protein